MRVPRRKKEEEARQLKSVRDNHLTQAKIDKMKQTLDWLKTTEKPRAIKELQHTQEMGDLSENAGYQAAKRHLRRTNSRILSLEERIKNAIPIKTGKSDTIQLGSMVTLSTDFTYQILGQAEADPKNGKISHKSPLGSVLMGKRAGDMVKIGEKELKINKIK